MELATILHFRDQIRSARIRAFEDAENFHDVVVALESLGAFQLGTRKNGFSAYEAALSQLAEQSALFEDVSKASSLHLSFSDLFTIVREGRNDAVHEGVFARNLAAHAVQLALIVEDALSMSASQVQHFMVRGVITAEKFYTLSYVRQLRFTAQRFLVTTAPNTSLPQASRKSFTSSPIPRVCLPDSMTTR